MTTAIGTSNPSTSSIRLSFPPILAILPTGSPLLAFRPLRAAHRRCRLRSSRPDVCLRRRPADGWRRFQVQCGVAVIDHSMFEEEVLKSDGPVLVEFVADWCGPCRLISPVVEWASQEYKDRLKVVKIDHDANPLLIEEYKVYGLPALILFKDGQEVPESRREGAMTKLKLKEYLDSFLGSVTVS